MKSLLFGTLLICSVLVSAQPKPYFQQEVNYTIEVTLDDRAHMLRGFESFEYINHSPDKLEFIYIHLWPNAYKNRKTAMARQLARTRNYFMWYALDEDKGFIDSLNFKVNGKAARFELTEEHIDIGVLHLSEPLPPGGRITVSTPFRVKIPSGVISRMGHIGQSYQITQWYPKPAVYDRDGWHPMPYLTQGEFYSEFGSFDVRITLPANYTVGATGDLQNADERARLDSLHEVSMALGTTAGSNEFPPSAASMKTLHYVQHNVHDFGWFADKRYRVLRGEVKLPHSGRTVTTWAMYTPANAALWFKAPEYLHDATYYYSLWNGDYPYNHVTAVDGTISAGGGMEYPNVTVIGNMGNAAMLDLVITHEVGHNWFYGILGSNERDNAWMDEGINSFNEDRYMAMKYPGMTLNDIFGMGTMGQRLGLDKFDYSVAGITQYLLSASVFADQPIQLTSDAFTEMNYGVIVYKKTSLVFQYLQGWLGEELFDRCMQHYFENWKFKHPSPADVRSSFETVTGQNLSWLFDTLIHTQARVNYRAGRLKKTDEGYSLRVENWGQVASPFSVSEIKEGQIVSTHWFEGIEPWSSTRISIAGRDADALRIDATGRMMDIDRTNNTVRTRGLLRRAEPLQVRMLTYLRRDDRNQLFITPVVGWNEYNKWMAGAHFSNMTVPLRQFEWSATPMYSFVTNSVNGFASATYYSRFVDVFFHARKFDSSNGSFLDLQHRSRYFKLGGGANIHLIPLRAGGSNRLSLDLKIEEWYFDRLTRYKEFNEQEYSSELHRSSDVLNLSLNLKKNWPGSLSTNTYYRRSIGDFMMNELTSSWSYLYLKKMKRRVSARLSAFYLEDSYDMPMVSVAGINGTDFFYEYLFLGRSEDWNKLLGRQFAQGQGNLGVPVDFYSTQWLTSATFSADVPVKLPLAVYGGWAWLRNQPNRYTTLDGVEHTQCIFGLCEDVFWNLGAKVHVVRDIFEIYVPLLYSKNIDDQLKARDARFTDRIMFELNLHLMSPSRLIRQNLSR